MAGCQVLAANRDLDGIAQVVCGQLLHRCGPRGAEHERLPVGAHGGADGADVGLKAEVKHAVRLVQHQVGHVLC